MKTEREDVSYASKVPATKTAGQIAFEKALEEKANREQHSEWDGGVSDRELLREAAELQQRWDAALAAAVQNREAVQNERAEGDKKAAEAGGEVQYSIAAREDKRNRVHPGMNDANRTTLLKEKVAVVPIYEGQADIVNSENANDLQSGKIRLIKAALKRIANQFDIPEIQYNTDFDIEVVYSTGTILESVSKNIMKTQELVKIIPILQRAVNGAIGIESHDNRYYFDTDTIAMHELISGYVEAGYYTPVLFGVRESKTAGNRLYVVVCSEKIKMTDIVKEPPGNKPARTSSPSVDINIADISHSVNDENLLEYFPDGLLSDEQKSKKYQAIAEMIRYTNDKNDRKYREYIQRGRIDAAKQMIEEAARRNGYTIKAFHGTNNREEKRTWNPITHTFDSEYKAFTVFKKTYEGQSGHFFASDEENAGGYGSTVYSVYLMINNPLVINCQGQNYDSIRYNGLDMDTYEWAEYAKKNRYDGVIFHNVRDGANFDDLAKPLHEYIVFDSNRIKSAEVITYDDNGAIIPISERFTPTRRDIRYSEWDGGMSDRELLREAAEQEGANEAVKRYAKKLDNLEAYQKRLERQEKKLEKSEISEKQREAVEKRIEDTRRLIERTEADLDKMDQRKDIRKAADAA